MTGMLHKVTAGGRIIHMEDKEIIGILDGLISKRVNESEIIEYKTNLFDKEMFGKYISALSNSAALLDEKREQKRIECARGVRCQKQHE